MAKEDDVERAMMLFHQNRPGKVLDRIDQSEKGLFRVIKYLEETQVPPTAKEISIALGVSTARITVVLQKLEQKQLIAKTASPTDARASFISLTEQGRAFARQLKHKMFESMEKVVDEFGIEELQKLFETLGKIQTLLENDMPDKMEELICSK